MLGFKKIKKCWQIFKSWKIFDFEKNVFRKKCFFENSKMHAFQKNNFPKKIFFRNRKFSTFENLSTFFDFFENQKFWFFYRKKSCSKSSYEKNGAKVFWLSFFSEKICFSKSKSKKCALTSAFQRAHLQLQRTKTRRAIPEKP